jgi:predicted nucleotidyltransferase component of viral defense system
MALDKTMIENLARISTAAGLPLQSLEKELRLFEFMPKFFHLLEENRIKAALYGGTALNKGYFGERQRFSKDIDIYLPSRGFRGRCDKVDGLLRSLKGYEIKKIHQSKETVAWSIGYGDEAWESLLIEARRQRTKEKAKNIELHSLLEFSGIPVLPIYVPSYSFEYLVAEKIIALGRRTLGKDIYDAHLALGMKPNAKLVLSHIRKITGRDPDEPVSLARHWLGKVNMKSSDMVELTDSIPMRHREDMRSMVASLKYDLERMLD